MRTQKYRKYGACLSLSLIVAAAGTDRVAADTDTPSARADVAIYGAYSLLGSGPQGSMFSGNGGGGGVAGQVNLPGHVFVESSYQYAHENGTDNGAAASAGANQIRGGLGLLFDIDELPIALFGKYQFVHFDYQPLSNGIKSARVSDEGSGIDFGARFGNDHIRLSVAGGFLNIGQKRGPEALAKLELPFGSHLYGFGEYRYDWLGGSNAADKLRLIDYHLGIGLRF